MSCEFTGFCALNASEQAAWVQAVFSVIAIGVAIFVPYWTERIRRKGEQESTIRKARGYTLGVMEATRTLVSSINSAIVSSREELADENLIETNENIQIPGVLMAHAQNLHEMGNAGLLLQDALMLVSRAKREIDEEDFRMRYAGTEYDEDGSIEKMSSIDFVATLEYAKKKLDASLKEMQHLFPGLSELSTDTTI
jgi:hypothetical protein